MKYVIALALLGIALVLALSSLVAGPMLAIPSVACTVAAQIIAFSDV